MDQNFRSGQPIWDAPAEPQGKGLGIAGFIVSTTALAFWFIISGIALIAAMAGGGLMLAVFWLIVSLLGALLSAIGLLQLNRTGGRGGLAIAGLVVGMLAAILSVFTISNVADVSKSMGHRTQNALRMLTDSAQMRKMVEEAVKDSAYKRP